MRTEGLSSLARLWLLVPLLWCSSAPALGALLRAQPVGDLSIEAIAHSSQAKTQGLALGEEAVEQVSVRARGVDVETGLWTYEVVYLQSSSAALEPTRCTCTGEGGLGILGQPYSSPFTYSNLRRSNGSYNRYADTYTSPYIHVCEVRGLAANAAFACTAGSAGESSAPVASFVTPPLPGSDNPMSFAVLADGGQSEFVSCFFSTQS